MFMSVDSRAYIVTAMPKTTQSRRESMGLGAIAVAANIDDAKPWHPLVTLVKSRRKHAATGQAETLYPDLRVSDKTRDRALRILDALFKVLEDRGYRVESRMPRPRMNSRGQLEPMT